MNNSLLVWLAYSFFVNLPLLKIVSYTNKKNKK